MEIDIGAFDPETRSVPVTFRYRDVTHPRNVNAVLTEAGDYDEEATTERVFEVADGVAHKINVGAITNPPPPPAPEA